MYMYLYCIIDYDKITCCVERSVVKNKRHKKKVKSLPIYSIHKRFSSMSNKTSSGPAGADSKVLNTRMFQGQSFEGGTFEGQLVRWSVKIVRELPSFSL